VLVLWRGEINDVLIYLQLPLADKVRTFYNPSRALRAARAARTHRLRAQPLYAPGGVFPISAASVLACKLPVSAAGISSGSSRTVDVARLKGNQRAARPFTNFYLHAPRVQGGIHGMPRTGGGARTLPAPTPKRTHTRAKVSVLQKIDFAGACRGFFFSSIVRPSARGLLSS